MEEHSSTISEDAQALLHDAPLAPAPPPLSQHAQSWLHLLPHPPHTSDLFHLNVDNFATKVIRDLIENRHFEFQLPTMYPASEACNHYFFEAKNRERLLGSKHFGIGYPMVFATVGGRTVAAPMFFWQLTIEPHTQQPDYWLVGRGEQQQFVPNYALFYWIDQHHGSALSERVRQLAQQGRMSSVLLSEIADGVRLLLGLQEQGLTLSVLPFPSQREVEIYQDHGVLHWTALAGIFPTTPVEVHMAPPALAPPTEADTSWQHHFTPLPLDPTQREVLQSISQHTLITVDGASGTGKTYTLSAALANALSLGKKCLVVSNNLAALRRAQHFLLEKGFGDLSFILRDATADRLFLADMLRAAADNKQKHAFEEEKFTTLLHKCRREQAKLDHSWEALHQPIFGEQSFRQVVGRFLRANRTVGKETLLSQLQPQDFEFSKEEFDRCVEAIKISEPLFRKFPAMGHPLSKLHSHIFTEKDPEMGLGAARAQTKTLLEKALALQNLYINKIADYTEALTEIYSDHYARLALQVKRVREQLEDGVLRYGKSFESPVTATEKLAGTFSEKYKEIIATKEKIGQDFEVMRKIYQQRKYFDFDFPKNIDLRHIPKIAKIAADFDTALKHWRKRIPAIVREDLKRLSHRSVHYDIDFKNEVEELEAALEQFLHTFNESGLYVEKAQHDMLTVPKRLEFLESLIEKLEETHFYLRDFSDFQVWQKHWLSLDAASQKVVQALCKVKPRNWVAAFESWYLHHLLTHEFSEKLVWDNETIDNLAEHLPALSRHLPYQISALWQRRKIEAFRKLKSTDPVGYKTWFGKDNRKLSATLPPQLLFKEHIHTLTEALPVLLMLPHVAATLLCDSNLKFDLLLIDEAHNIIGQQGYPLFKWAKKIVVFGDTKQDMTPHAEDDLLEFCKKSGAHTIHLNYQHQNCPEEWIQFNQVAFQTPFQRIPKAISARDTTEIEKVGGRFDEWSQVNESEARQIISWLNCIEPRPNKQYPMVGIACATVQQRNYIAGQLLKIRQRRAAGHEKIQQLHLNGMGVFHFGELQGQHIDVLLVSMVHGLTSVDGTLTSSLDFWNTPLGINQLHILLTRATERLFVAHSLPDDWHTQPFDPQHQRGMVILAHFLQYAALVRQGHQSEAAVLLEKMKQQVNYPTTYFPADIFMEEVEIALQPYFEPGSICRNATVEGMTVPLLIQSHGAAQRHHILLFDGVLANTRVNSFEWEVQLRQYFAKNNIEFVPTLSVQWWKSPKQEARRLAARILSHA